jgi:hypothetical protein
MTPFFPSMAETQSPHQNISNNGDSSDDVNVDIKTLEQEMRNEQKRALQRLNGQDVPITGAIDERQSHRLMLRSAYDEYCWDGEPPFTTSTLEHAACVDYILYSAEKLEPCTVLSLPEIHDLTNDDTRNLEMCHDYSAATVAPEGWNATYNPSEAEDNPLAYSGTWVGAIKTNENKIHRYLPNTEFPSSHLALLVEFRYRNQGLAADWSEPDPHKIKKQQKPQELQQQSETDQVKSQDSYWSEPEQHIVIEED